jgi:hypothetical protein
MTKVTIKSFSLTLLVASLSACGGGGGSSTLSAFTNWGSVSPSSSIVVSGDSYQGTYIYNVATDTVTGLTTGSHQSGASYTATYRSDGYLDSATINSALGTNISWSRNAGDIFGYLVINPSIDAVVSANGQDYALAANPTAFGFNYQSFGTWVTGGGTGSGTYGFISVGNQTSGSGVPASGQGYFTGATGGRYSDSNGIPYFTGSNMVVSLDFGARGGLFLTSGTEITRDLLTTTSATNLDLRGNFTWAPGSATFHGTLSTTGNGTGGSPLPGTLSGRFYGPVANEMGGTFAVQSGNEFYGGAFGAKR